METRRRDDPLLQRHQGDLSKEVPGATIDNLIPAHLAALVDKQMKLSDTNLEIVDGIVDLMLKFPQH